jgi:predicted DNA-binding transcriptional regulator
MDDVIIEKVFELVKHSNGIKASEIAKNLKISRKEVNKILYGRLAKLCVQDEQYRWYCRSEYSLSVDSSNISLDEIEKAFSNANFTVEELETFLNNVEN